MKLYLLFMLLLLLPLVSAEGNIYTIDFSEKPEVSVVLSERDLVRFAVDNKEHKFMVRDISLAKQRVEITVFIEGAETPYYQTLHPGLALKLDFEKDWVIDMDVSIAKFVDSGKVMLYFKKVKEGTPKPSETRSSKKLTGSFSFLNAVNMPSWDDIKKGPSYEDLKNPSYLKANWWWPVSLLIILIVLFWGRRGRKFSLKLRKMFR